MDDAQVDATAAGRSLAVRRWGSQRIDRLAEEVTSRHAEISVDVAQRLRAALAADVEDTE